jgi:drug/metabolite transporter (DMT)-like permease
VRRFVVSHALDLGLVFVVLVWGISPVAFKIALTELEPLTFVMMRFLLLSLVSVAVLLFRARRDRTLQPFRIRLTDLGWLALSGLSGYGIYQLLYIEGLAHTTPFASALFMATIPLWSAAILAMLRIEHIRAAQWAGIAISLTGIFWFLFAAGSRVSELPADHALSSSEIILGDALTLGAAALFAVYGVVNKRLATRYSPVELMCYTLLIGTLALAPFGAIAIVHQDWSQVTWRSWVILPYSVLFPIYITYSIWNWAIGIRGVGYVTIFNYAVPILAGFASWMLFGEGLNGIQMASAALTLGGMLLAGWAIRRNRASAPIPQVTQAESEAETPLAREITD